jgi:hypothetical protein
MNRMEVRVDCPPSWPLLVVQPATQKTEDSIDAKTETGKAAPERHNCD